VAAFSTATPEPSTTDSSSSTGAIVGGVVGGVLVLCALAAFAVIQARKQKAVRSSVRPSGQDSLMMKFKSETVVEVPDQGISKM